MTSGPILSHSGTSLTSGEPIFRRAAHNLGRDYSLAAGLVRRNPLDFSLPSNPALLALVQRIEEEIETLSDLMVPMNEDVIRRGVDILRRELKDLTEDVSVSERASLRRFLGVEGPEGLIFLIGELVITARRAPASGAELD